MASSDQPHTSLTLNDVMHAIEELGKDLQATKSRVAELADSRRTTFGENPRYFSATNSGWRPPASRTTPPTLDPAPRMRVDAPRFSGEDPTGWIFRVQKYFDYFLTPEPERWHLVAMFIDHPASEWFHYFQANNPMATWPEFLDAVQQRFDPTYYENYVGLLSKLTQSSTILAYQTEFETILNKVSGVPESTLIAMYIAGLKQPIRREVNLRNPTTLPLTFALARELSACHLEAAGSYSRELRRPWSARPPTTPSAGLLPTPGPSSRPSPVPQASHNSESSPKLPVVRLTNAEKTERTKKGLCWYCDEKWIAGQNCKHRFLLLMGPDEEDAEPLEQLDTPNSDDLIIADISSMHALAGSPNPRALKLAGMVNGSAVQVLLDSGSTHNFIHPGVAERLQLVLHPVPSFRVYVGNGDSLRCAYACPQTAISLQGHAFLIDLYLLEIHGTDVVLGVQWLQTLGKVAHDYAQMTMEFMWQGNSITLHGNTPSPRQISYGQFCTMVAASTSWALYELVVSQPEKAPPGDAHMDVPTDVPSSLRAVILDHVIQTPDQQFYIRKLMGFKFRIEYKTGTSNRAADALSRRDEDDATVLFVATAQPLPLLLDSLRAENGALPDLQRLHAECEAGRAPSHISVQEGLLYYKRRLYVSPGSPLRDRILTEFHSTPLAGHQGVERTFRRIAAVFYWPGLRREVRRFVASCENRMRAQANKHRRDVSFDVGDWVLLKLQPYRQYSIARPLSAKLGHCYYGPFEILERVGSVAYRLRLPEGCRIHDVFHVSLLRPFIRRPDSDPNPTLPDSFFKGRPISVPVSALQQRMVLVDGKPQQQWQIRWSDVADGGFTWEPVEDLLQHFPDLRLEDKADSNPGELIRDR
ncbi:unnamed protein product [Cuscuta campestris]|uniref:Ty3 transposon capsid-like protein domain-containing protein n=1 Tax=Cuscuta campestris TaxID=132261 RepID=A0A484KYM1_9ASTE|nr:unnamed protein product [Cuscuta campestris]